MIPSYVPALCRLPHLSNTQLPISTYSTQLLPMLLAMAVPLSRCLATRYITPQTATAPKSWAPGLPRTRTTTRNNTRTTQEQRKNNTRTTQEQHKNNPRKTPCQSANKKKTLLHPPTEHATYEPMMSTDPIIILWSHDFDQVTAARSVRSGYVRVESGSGPVWSAMHDRDEVY